MNYNELVKNLRQCAEGSCAGGKNDLVEIGCRGMLQNEAADAIEELQRQVEKEKAFAECWDCKARFEKLLEAYKEERNAAVELTGELASKPRWIPVTERLPGVEDDVIISVLTYFSNRKPIRTVTMDYINTEGKWDGASCDWRHEVTHWMPLPEPPAEEGE